MNSINSRRFHPASCGNALIELPASIEKGLTVSVAKFDTFGLVTAEDHFCDSLWST